MKSMLSHESNKNNGICAIFSWNIFSKWQKKCKNKWKDMKDNNIVLDILCDTTLTQVALINSINYYVLHWRNEVFNSVPFLPSPLYLLRDVRSWPLHSPGNNMKVLGNKMRGWNPTLWKTESVTRHPTPIPAVLRMSLFHLGSSGKELLQHKLLRLY